MSHAIVSTKLSFTHPAEIIFCHIVVNTILSHIFPALIGFQFLAEVRASISKTKDFTGFGEPPKPEFWIDSGTPNNAPVHVAFRASSHAQVDNFYTAALSTGGCDNGAPGIRAHYHPNYYAAFILDLDGHNIEVVCHEPE